MEFLIPFTAGAVLAALVAWLLHSRTAQEAPKPSVRTHENLDTVSAWQPEGVRILTVQERLAHQTLSRALPEYVVLAQVALARFLYVPKRHSFAEWLDRVGHLSADLVVCDSSSQVLAVVEVHSSKDSERSRERHQVMERVLKAAGIRVVTWAEGSIPSPEVARDALKPILESATLAAELARAKRPDRRGGGTSAERDEGPDTVPIREPIPSTWFDLIESPPGAVEPPPPKSVR
jgi:hypothetical protein